MRGGTGRSVLESRHPVSVLWFRRISLSPNFVISPRAIVIATSTNRYRDSVNVRMLNKDRHRGGAQSQAPALVIRSEFPLSSLCFLRCRPIPCSPRSAQPALEKATALPNGHTRCWDAGSWCLSDRTQKPPLVAARGSERHVSPPVPVPPPPQQSLDPSQQGRVATFRVQP